MSSCWGPCLRSILVLFCGLVANVATRAGEASPAAAWMLLQQRDHEALRALLPALRTQHEAQAEALALALQAREQGALDEAALQALQQRFPGDAELQFRAGQLWLQQARQASVFTRRSLAKHYIAATLRAAQLAPTHPRLLAEAGVAAGQPAFFGGDPARQPGLVQQLSRLDPTYYLIARMDLAQNTQDEDAGRRCMDEAEQRFPDSVLALSRAANLAWTFGDTGRAQRLFLRSCGLSPGADDDREWSDWYASCYHAAALTLDGEGSAAAASPVLRRAMARDRVDDAEHRELLGMIEQLERKARS